MAFFYGHLLDINCHFGLVSLFCWLPLCPMPFFFFWTLWSCIFSVTQLWLFESLLVSWYAFWVCLQAVQGKFSLYIYSYYSCYYYLFLRAFFFFLVFLLFLKTISNSSGSRLFVILRFLVLQWNQMPHEMYVILNLGITSTICVGFLHF